MAVAPEYLHLVYPDLDIRALLYGRNSHDPSGKGRSVASQLHEGHTLCCEHGWPIAGVFDKDVGKSASRFAKKRRDDFEALLEAIEQRMGTVVVAFEASRYYRDLEAYVRLRAACLRAGVLLCYNGEVYDLSKRADRKATARDAVDAEDEAEGIRDRNVRTVRRLVAEGWPAGRTPYGYQRLYSRTTGELEKQVPHPVRSFYVREIFRRFLGDDDTDPQTLYGIAQWLNSAPAAAHHRGHPWDAERVRIQLRILAYAGRRVHHGVDAGKGTWEPVISLEDFERVQVLLDDPDRRTNVRQTGVKHLQTGIATCGNHPDQPSALRAGPRNGHTSYVCDARQDVSIRKEVLDAYVETAAIRWWSSDAAVAAFRRDEDTGKVDRARKLQRALEQQLLDARNAAAEFDEDGTPRLSPVSLGMLEKRLQPMIDEARAEASAPLGVPPELRRLVGRPDAEAVWEAMTLIERRAALRASVRIRLCSAHVRGAQSIRPGRVRLDFRGSPDFQLYVPRRQTPA
jgi:site-specific DNA recombinase